MANKTLSSILTFITAIHQKEGAEPNRSLYLLLLNEAINEVSMQIDGISKTWDVAAGDATLTDNYIAIPADCKRVTNVIYDDIPLDKLDKSEFDYYYTGWRTDTGMPGAYHLETNKIVFDTIPDTSDILIVGLATLPEWVEAAGEVAETNPLIYIPEYLQMSPAYYVLANLPADPDSKVGIARVEKYTRMCEARLPMIVDGLRSRALHSYDGE